jgi:hypothetical protein
VKITDLKLEVNPDSIPIETLIDARTVLGEEIKTLIGNAKRETSN